MYLRCVVRRLRLSREKHSQGQPDYNDRHHDSKRNLESALLKTSKQWLRLRCRRCFKRFWHVMKDKRISRLLFPHLDIRTKLMPIVGPCRRSRFPLLMVRQYLEKLLKSVGIILSEVYVLQTM